MGAIVDSDIRKDCLYQPGSWEKGGWFQRGKHSADEAVTKPSGEPPVPNPSEELEEAAVLRSEDPMAGEENEQGDIPDEQARLLQNQEEGKIEPPEDDAEKPPA